ncbi:MAG TPA: molybdate ABC transporter permease subunit [Caulobacteraceae bacterium]|nr:molybdate ABC transporter permease subunit [Caulobacteraceae bacterium]
MEQVITTTVALAATTTILLLVLATPLAWWLARHPRWWKEIVAAVTAMPLVLPPTVLGFYLLLALAPQSPLMAPLHALGVRTLAFTFTGLVIGSMVFSLPFAVQPIRDAFESMGERPMQVAATMRASPFDAFFTVALPMARRGFLTAAILVFAHTVGEFGVVLMIGGGIPGRTQVVSVRIWQLVESSHYAEAHVLAGGLVIFAFMVILAMMWIDRSTRLRAL